MKIHFPRLTVIQDSAVCKGKLKWSLLEIFYVCFPYYEICLKLEENTFTISFIEIKY